MGDTTVEAPQPSPEERALQQKQLELLNKQESDLEKIKKIQLANMGLKETPDGQIVRMTPEEIDASLTPTQKLARENLQLGLMRQQKALKGELPVPKGLIDDINQQRQEYEVKLARKLGSNWRNTTIGARAIAEFDRVANIAKDAARRGELQVGANINIAQLANRRAEQGQEAGLLAAFPARTAPIINEAGLLQQPYQFQRNLEFNANAQNAATEAAGIGSIGSFVGSAGLGALTGGFGLLPGLAAGAAGAGTGALIGLTGANLLPRVKQ